MTQHIDQVGFDLIKTFEGKKNAAYQDSVGIWTIGIGFIRYECGNRAGSCVKKGDCLTDDEIKSEFLKQIEKYENAVSAAVKVPLTQSQFNACVSLCYNIGIAAFSRSTVVKCLNERKYQAACKAFALWNKAGGRIIKGLANRRAAEQKEFFRCG